MFWPGLIKPRIFIGSLVGWEKNTTTLDTTQELKHHTLEPKWVNEQLHTKLIWALFRSLLGQVKLVNMLNKLQMQLNALTDRPQDSIKEALFLFASTTPLPQSKQKYTRLGTEGRDSTGMDSLLEMQELTLVFMQVKKRTASGPDEITKIALPDPPGNKLQKVLKLINKQRKTGKITHSRRRPMPSSFPYQGHPFKLPLNLGLFNKCNPQVNV